MRAQSRYLHCSKGPWTNKKNKTGDRERAAWSNSDFFRLEKCLKMTVRKMSKILWVSKTSYNGSNKALFESKIQTKKQYSLRAVEQRSLFL